MSTVFITGSGKRIGKTLAVEFARRGWDVGIHYHTSLEGAEDTAMQARAFGVKTALVKADVRIKEEIEGAFEEARGVIGIPDVLVNNAGIFPERMELGEITEEFWDNTMNTNLRSEFFVSQIFSGKARRGSRIINISSLGGVEIWKNRIAYNVSKSAVIQLTKGLARELAPNITVNAVCPGAIYIEDDPAEHDKTMIDLKKIPMGRFGRAEDVFDAVYFFATCSDYITAQTLIVDGGYHDGR